MRKLFFAVGALIAVSSIAAIVIGRKNKKNKVPETLTEKDISDDVLFSMAKNIEKNRIVIDGETVTVVKAVEVKNISEERYVEFIIIRNNRSQKIMLTDKEVASLNYDIMCS